MILLVSLNCFCFTYKNIKALNQARSDGGSRHQLRLRFQFSHLEGGQSGEKTPGLTLQRTEKGQTGKKIPTTKSV